MRRPLLSIGRLLLLLIIATAAGIGHSQELVTLPGGVWAIVPPEGFDAVKDPVALFRHPSGAAIVVQDTPKGPVSKSYFDMTPEQQSQVRLDEVTEVTVNGRNGFLGVLYIHARHAINILLVLEGETSNAMIVAILPDKAVAQVPVEALRQAVLTAVERPKDINARLDDLPFVIGDMAGMRVATYAVGVAVLLTDGPLDDMDQAADQTFTQMASIKIPPGEALDQDMPLGPVKERILKMFPNAVVLDSVMIETAQGNVMEVRYERRTSGGELVAGVTWVKLIGDRMTVMICQYPVGADESLAKLAKVRDGLRAK